MIAVGIRGWASLWRAAILAPPPIGTITCAGLIYKNSFLFSDKFWWGLLGKFQRQIGSQKVPRQTMNFATLPSLIALAILVVVFRAILRQSTSERLHLWLTGWVLVLIHFAAQFVDVGQGSWNRVASAVSLDALELASLAFLVSAAQRANNRGRQVLLAAVVGVPAIVYTNAVIWDIAARSFYYAVIALALAGALSVIWILHRKISAYVIGMWTGCVVVSCTITWAVVRGKFELGIILVLAALNFVVAVLFWRQFHRATVGVLTTVLGFVAWGSVFPMGMLLQTFSIHVQSEVWNIPKYFVAVGMIVILLEDQVRRSEYLAYHDELTGLPNRRLLEDRLEQALARATRKANKVAVLLIDLDHFKQVNDTYGHRIGDLTLQQVVTRLAGRMRVSDTLARSGGDEFTVVSDVMDAAGAQVLVANLEMAFTVPFKLEGKIIHTGLSIGLALFPDDGRTPDELYAAADQAMYVSKRASRTSGGISAISQFRM
jgi:diguanylate cyclase